MKPEIFEHNPAKVYVAVNVDFTVDGDMIPRTITWEDGRVYEIDKILDQRSAPARIAGGYGERFTVEINGKESYLFFEENIYMKGANIGRWFVERK